MRFNLRVRGQMVQRFHNENDGLLEVDREPRWFNSTNHNLESMSQFHSVYSEICGEIWDELENFTSTGSGWSLDRVTAITVDTWVYNPLNVGSRMQQLEVPPKIKASRCTVNIQSTREDCFKYAVIGSACKDEMKRERLRLSNPSSYRKLMGRFNFSGITFPTPVKEKSFQLFEMNNPKFALNILSLKVPRTKTEEGKTKKQMKKKKKKKKVVGVVVPKKNISSKAKDKPFNIQPYRTSPFARKEHGRQNIFILLLHNPASKQSHYVAITKLNVLVSHAKKKLHDYRSKFCWDCRRSFSRSSKKESAKAFDEHIAFCNSPIYGPNLLKTRSFQAYNKEVREDAGKTVCTNCFHVYEGKSIKEQEEDLRRHQKYCLNNRPAVVNFPHEDEISFTRYRNRRQPPFVVYLDTESVLGDKKTTQEVEELNRKWKETTTTTTTTTTTISTYHDEEEGEEEDSDDWEEEDEEEEDEEDEEDDNSSLKDWPDSYEEIDKSPNYTAETSVEVDKTPISEDDLTKDDENVINHHILSSYCYKVVAMNKELQSFFPKPISYAGKDAGVKMFEDLAKIQSEITTIWHETRSKWATTMDMQPMTKPEQQEYEKTTVCHLCSDPIVSKQDEEEYELQYQSWKAEKVLHFKRKNYVNRGPKVRNHNHFTGI